MELAVLNTAGKETGKKVSLEAEIFGIEPNDHAIYLDVKQYLAANRQGTHKSKERGEVSGSTRKIKRQKGTGTARAGSIKSPVFRGGGRMFGPRPRNYDFKLNKKVKQLARKSALAYKAKDNAILVIEDFNFETPKTKNYFAILNSLKISEKKSLVVLDGTDSNVYLSSRNLQNHMVVPVNELNTYDIMKCNSIVFSEGALKKLQTVE
ncbi:MAG: 50S ribosomal protein L4 [Bacteroidota bacterium]|nr:MAG: 50S ribosomal protein L4 [Bacteroidota bacterium]